ncbi:MAG: AlpA family phage regulatory protein [Alphaproteobacteria bacterium]|nr:AlpA family phage regulatory protein [Alphaproteobacteria bacterium]
MATKKSARASISIEAHLHPVGDLIRGWAGVCAAVGKSRVQLWRDIRDGRFPAPIELGPNSVAWLRSEVDAFLSSRPRRTYAASEQNLPAAKVGEAA